LDILLFLFYTLIFSVCFSNDKSKYVTMAFTNYQQLQRLEQSIADFRRALAQPLLVPVRTVATDASGISTMEILQEDLPFWSPSFCKTRVFDYPNVLTVEFLTWPTPHFFIVGTIEGVLSAMRRRYTYFIQQHAIALFKKESADSLIFIPPQPVPPITCGQPDSLMPDLDPIPDDLYANMPDLEPIPADLIDLNTTCYNCIHASIQTANTLQPPIDTSPTLTRYDKILNTDSCTDDDDAAFDKACRSSDVTTSPETDNFDFDPTDNINLEPTTPLTRH
jgi:hypothetical protein